MRSILIFCFAAFTATNSFSQHNNACTASVLRINVNAEQSSFSAKIAHPYDQPTINKKLKTAHRFIISGAVLTACGSAFAIAGCATLTKPSRSRGPTDQKVPDYSSPILWITSIPFLAPGIPVLAIGLTQQHKWKKINTELSIQTGIMNDGTLGLAMAF